MINIFINNSCNLNKNELKNYKQIIKNTVRATLFHEKLYFKQVDVSVSFITANEIKELNNTYRNKDSATDVLSFPLYEPFEIYNTKDNEVNLGDIVICLDIASEQAKSLDQSIYREVKFLTLHSTLHLIGYDHENELDEVEMLTKQRRIMRIIK